MLYGELTASGLGFIMKHVLQRAMSEILRQQGTFEVTLKANYDGVADADLTTTADEAAQRICAKLLGEAFPQYGKVGEEGLLRVECTFEGREIVITIDPLDGSKNYVRGEAFGVATMITVSIDGEVAAVYIGDVNTGDMYYYRPESPNVWRLREGGGTFSKVNLSGLQRATPLAEWYVLLRHEREAYDPLIAAVARSTERGGVFKAYQVTSGSIGLSMARLWTDSVVAHVLGAGNSTPWDDVPIVGIGKKLGMVWLRPTSVWRLFEEFDPVLPLGGIVKRNHDAIVMHRSRVAAFHAAVSRAAGGA
jgi:fructose-1,6-bisphosphatase/inositol monophosphatase family enzyme